MPVDGLGGDVGRQSLTEVGAAGARAPRPPGNRRIVAANDATRDDKPAVPDASTAHASRDPALRPPARIATRGERLVALSALAVLAIAAVLFVERIGGLRSAPPPTHAPILELSSPPADNAAPVPPAPLVAPTSDATRPAGVARHASLVVASFDTRVRLRTCDDVWDRAAACERGRQSGSGN